MKYFLISLLVIVSAVNQGLFAQNNAQLSIGSLYSDFAGLNVELGAKKTVVLNLGLTARLSSNFNSFYGIRTGLNYQLLSKNKLNLDLGLEYALELFHPVENTENIWSHNLEIPLILNYDLSPKYSLYGGVTSSFNLNEYEPHRYIDNLRIGISYKW